MTKSSVSRSHTIPLNAGDHLKIILSWAASADLDLFLKFGGSTVASETSGSLNPEILEYSVPASGDYQSLVAELSPGGGFCLQIFVNGVQIETYFSEMSILGINLENSCEIKIIYFGQNKIKLYAPSARVLSSNFIDENQTSLNPKFVKGLIPSAGLSNFVVVSPVSSMFVEVWTFSNMKCLHFCSSKKYSSLASGTSSTCICFENFSWNSALDECTPNCLMIPKGISWDSSSNACTCQTGFIWSTENGRCEIPCSSIERALELFEEKYEICECEDIDKLIWKIDKKKCEIDCGNISWAIEVEEGYINRCVCELGFFWNASTLLCDEICGDSLSFTFECDNKLGVALDGCSDDCTVMPDFICEVDGLKQTECSYDGEITFDFVSWKRNGILNEFTYIVKIIEPILFVFLSQRENITSKILGLENDKILMKSSSFNTESFEISFEAEYFEDLTKEEFFNIKFYQNLIQPKIFQAEVQFNFFYEPIFFEKTDYEIYSLIHYCCWFIIVLAWISFCLSLFLRKLYGVEALIMVQLCWVSLIWNESSFALIFYAVFPLKYVTGYNINILDEGDLFQGLSYLDKYEISRFNFLNNFNIFTFLILFPMVVVIVCYLNLFKSIWEYKKNDNAVWKWGIKEETILSPTVKRNFRFYEYSLQLLLYGNLASLVYLTECITLYYSTGDFKFMVNHIAIGVCTLTILFIFVKFVQAPDYFENIVNSFKKGKHYSKFIFFQVFIFVLIVVSVTLVKEKFAVLISCGVMLFTIIILRPYKKTKQNICCFINYLVISSFFTFHFLLDYFPYRMKENKEFLTMYLMINICGLVPFAIFLGNFCLVYDYLVDEKIAVILKQFEKDETMIEMEMIIDSIENSDVNKKIKSQSRQSIFSRVLFGERNIKNSSLALNFDGLDSENVRALNLEANSSIKFNLEKVCMSDEIRNEIKNKLKEIRTELQIFPIFSKGNTHDEVRIENDPKEFKKEISCNETNQEKVESLSKEREEINELNTNSEVDGGESLEVVVRNVIQCESRFIGLNGVLQKLKREEEKSKNMDTNFLLQAYDDIQ